eukprot:scaffold1094_cov322-Prasinococcus_capsulatus_cf.AAC.10
MSSTRAALAQAPSRSALAVRASRRERRVLRAPGIDVHGDELRMLTRGPLCDVRQGHWATTPSGASARTCWARRAWACSTSSASPTACATSRCEPSADGGSYVGGLFAGTAATATAADAAPTAVAVRGVVAHAATVVRPRRHARRRRRRCRRWCASCCWAPPASTASAPSSTSRNTQPTRRCRDCRARCALAESLQGVACLRLHLRVRLRSQPG